MEESSSSLAYSDNLQEEYYQTFLMKDMNSDAIQMAFVSMPGSKLK